MSGVARAGAEDIGKQAPALVGSQWINPQQKDAVKFEGFKGHVTVLHFWTFSCINCKHNLPYYDKWVSAYDPKEVQIVGVHTPELDFEHDPAQLRAAIRHLGIRFPVLVDGDGENWNRYNQHYWPTVYLIDKTGKVRDVWEGELEYQGQQGFEKLSREVEVLRKE